MFTGIIEAVGTLVERKSHGKDQSLKIEADFDFGSCQLGDSIASNGVCLTAVELGKNYFVADASFETLSLTTLGKLPLGAKINLERALTPTTRLGGHIVSGHIDGKGVLTDRAADGRSERLVFACEPELAKYIVKKGSITVDGISLTVNKVDGFAFHLNIVPHTLKNTTLGDMEIGTEVNLEVDLIARYVEKLLLNSNNNTGLTAEKLIANGF
ncbi:MAG: riboflavin synthase [Cardiobacteriaceae bacterium]|nr:riboflavin synthase [Cardiobacteriaceae bacterium]